MDNLREYLKIKSMSSSEEITEYVSASIDSSNLKNFIVSFSNYYTILKAIEKENNADLWEEYERLKARFHNQKRERKERNSPKPIEISEVASTTASHEARVIPLFPKDGRFRR